VGFANLLHLARMALGVLRVRLHQSFESKRTALAMMAGTIERSDRELFEELVIFRAQAAQSLERLLGLAARVVEILRPGILIESENRRVVLRDYHAHAVCEDELGIGEMRDDLADAPLARRDDIVLFFAEHAGQDHGEHLGAAAEAFQKSG